MTVGVDTHGPARATRPDRVGSDDRRGAVWGAWGQGPGRPPIIDRRRALALGHKLVAGHREARDYRLYETYEEALRHARSYQRFLRQQGLNVRARVRSARGRWEVYVTAYPKPEGVVQISVAGGANPAWSADSRELYYFQGREFIAVTVATDRGLRVVGRRTLFEGDFRQYRWHRQYDVHPDGTHFVMIEDPPGGHLEIILNWFTELEQIPDRAN